MYRRYMDGTFLLLHSAEHIENIKKYLNKQHKKISFTSENQQNGWLSFLDIKINRETKKFVTSVYWKPIFSGAFTNFESFVCKYYKRSVIDTLLFRGLVYAPIWKSFIRKLVLWSQSSKAMPTLRTSLIHASNIF